MPRLRGTQASEVLLGQTEPRPHDWGASLDIPAGSAGGVIWNVLGRPNPRGGTRCTLRGWWAIQCHSAHEREVGAIIGPSPGELPPEINPREGADPY